MSLPVAIAATPTVVTASAMLVKPVAADVSIEISNAVPSTAPAIVKASAVVDSAPNAAVDVVALSTENVPAGTV